MSIQLESDKCWITDPDSLRIKRYLSDTRTYFREGTWIRQYFVSFFPNIQINDDGKLYFDFGTLEPDCLSLKGENLSNTKIPAELVSQFETAVGNYLEHISNSKLNFNEEVSVEEFSMPNPETHPDLYWVVETESGYRLIILWGLESTKENGNVKIDRLFEILKSRFSGKVSLKKKIQPLSKPKAGKEEDVIKDEKKEPEPVVLPTPVKVEPEPVVKQSEPESSVEIRREDDPKPKGEKKQAKASKKQPKQTTKVVEKPSEKKAKPPTSNSALMKAAPAAKSKAETPAKPKPKTQPEPKVDENKPKRSLGWLLWLLVPVAIWVVVTEISLAYLGEDVQLEGVASFSKSAVIELTAGEEVELLNGETYASSESDAVLSFGELPQAGHYKFKVIDAESGDIKRTVEHDYANVRNDMASSLVASLFVDQEVVAVGSPVTIRFDGSHRTDSASDVEYQISWGEGSAVFDTVDTSDGTASHVFETAGSYRVTLLIKESDDKWDYDSKSITVYDGDEPPVVETVGLPPVVDVAVLSVVKEEGGTEVTLDISGTFDPDGEVETIDVDWGDGYKQTVNAPFKRVSRKVVGLSNMSISLIARDASGLESPKPAFVFVDFQSSLINDIERYGAKAPLKPSRRIFIGENPDEFRITKIAYKDPVRNKKAYEYVLHNPTNAALSPLVDVEWTIRSAGGVVVTQKDSRKINLQLAEGVSSMTVKAKTIDGKELQSTERISVQVNKNLSPLMKAMDWIVHRFPYLSISYYLSR